MVAGGSVRPKFKDLLCGSQRISAFSAFELPFNAENTEVRRGRRETNLGVAAALTTTCGGGAGCGSGSATAA